MPIIPPPTVSLPYDTVDSALNVGRVRMNDAIVSLGGDILTDEQPFTQVMCNSAWRKLQAFLTTLGYSRFKDRKVLLNYPPVASNVASDPSSQTMLNWVQYFDGYNYYFPPNINVLPQTLIQPLKVWERITGSNMQFMPMRMAEDGLPSVLKGWRNGWWEWREDGLYMPGSLYSMDIQIEFAAYLADFATVGSVQWYQQPIPIMRAQSALANYFCAEAALGRDDVDAQTFVAAAEQDARLIFNVDVSMKQRTPAQRRSFSGRGRSSYGGCYGYN